MSKTFINTNAIWGQVDQPKTSNNKITYYGDYHTFEDIDTNQFTDKVLVWHRPEFPKEEWRYGLYGIKTKPTWDYVEEDNILTLELNHNIQKIHFITYGDNTFKKSKAKILKEAKEFGVFTTITGYGPEDLDDNFKETYKDILKEPRIAGYGIWRPYIIKEKLKTIDDNDILIYLDAGCTINTKGTPRLYDYINMLNNTDKGIISFQYPYLKEKNWTTKEIFNYFNIELDSNIGNSGQLLDGILIMKKNKHLINIINIWNKVINDNVLLFTDYYNNVNQEKYFIENRHEQSILSMIRKIYGSIVLKSCEVLLKNPNFLKYPFLATRIRN